MPARPVRPVILAVDTTREHGSIALSRGGDVIEEVALHAPGGFSQILYGELERLFGRHSVRTADVDCFAAASGPGSFTGVRVGLACVKGLAEAVGRPAMAVSNLEALARCGTTRLRGALIDARRGDIYGAVYDDAGRIVSPEVVSRLDAWLATLPTGVEEFVCADALPLPGLVPAPLSLAHVIAAIANDRLLRGEAGDPAGLDANYVRRSDAELFWKEW
jgi:tRNA threonylcarbamoyladenosine biosynthesis protein TsaB